MRIQLVSPHRYPAYGENGSGLHPREFASGSAFHLHDLLALGLAEEGHEVFYQTKGGAEADPPPGVTLLSRLVPEADICHTPGGAPGSTDEIVEFAARYHKPFLQTCHMYRPGETAGSNWVFVSQSLARAYGSERVVLNGLNPNDYIYSEAKEDYLLFMSAMDKAINKGLDLALALSRSKGFRLIVAGTGTNYETIQYVSGLCAAAGADYVGDVRGVRKAELISGARALLFPSRMNEGHPLVIIEAMFSGTPVISSTCGGSVEMVTPETGFLCHREEEWGGAVDRLGEISPARCREIALENYDYRRMVRDYVREYELEMENFGA
jgi:glycosyltransferase involved in cell wall biosynthesis